MRVNIQAVGKIYDRTSEKITSEQERTDGQTGDI